MRITFVTTQGPAGSTVIGRVSPLAEELGKQHNVTVLVHGSVGDLQATSYKLQATGSDPFTRTASGKKRLRGLSLIFRLLANAIMAAGRILELKPQILVIVKPLPENVLAARLATLFYRPKKIILDVDDFELTANVLTSLSQRAAIHWSERMGAKLADHIVTASPFLSDHFEQLTQNKKPVTLIPTGLRPASAKASAGRQGDGRQGRSVNYSLQPTTYNLIYAGSLSISSGHRVDLLPEILKKVREKHPMAQLHIYGTGDDRQKLKDEFQKLNLDKAVTWHGRFTVSELASQLPASTILIDPIDASISNRAKSSFRVMLAAALGLPIVTSDIGIRPYLLPQSLHAKFFASPGEASAYADKIAHLIREPLSPENAESMRRHAEEFSWLHLAEKYEKIIAS